MRDVGGVAEVVVVLVAGADALASALKAPNCALTSVDASDNELTAKGKKALQQAAGSR